MAQGAAERASVEPALKRVARAFFRGNALSGMHSAIPYDRRDRERGGPRQAAVGGERLAEVGREKHAGS